MARRRYVSIAAMRAEGISETDVTDARLGRLIEFASASIELYTKQYFIPTEDVLEIDGRESSLISLPNSLPIIKINSIFVDTDRSRLRRNPCGVRLQPYNRAWGQLNPKDYTLKENYRQIEVLNAGDALYSGSHMRHYSTARNPVWAEGSKNVKVDGVFGWIECHKEVTTTTDADTVTTQDLISVTDAVDFEPDDVIIIRTAGRDTVRILDGVDYVNNDLICDKISQVVPSGTEIISYGKIPLPIIEATIRLVGLKQNGLLPGNNPQIIERAIFREKIDNYEWEADENLINGLWNISDTSWASTGDLYVDRILDEFKPMVYLGYA